jgi:hypothetical protein
MLITPNILFMTSNTSLLTSNTLIATPNTSVLGVVYTSYTFVYIYTNMLTRYAF